MLVGGTSGRQMCNLPEEDFPQVGDFSFFPGIIEIGNILTDLVRLFETRGDKTTNFEDSRSFKK